MIHNAPSSRTAASVKRLLQDGLSVREVSFRLKVSRRWVYYVIRSDPKNPLPSNRPIRRGTRLEQQIVFAVLRDRVPVREAARLFSQTPARIRAVLLGKLRK